MSSADVIDALFDRTVDIVQSLPKSGPIQTSYEEKLALYSLYKQATEGDVTSKRPGMLDMLGRAKWDAWAQRSGMNPLDAKQLYVESMMRTLRKFGDRPQAIELIEELEAFSGDVAERVMRGALDTEDTSSETSSAPAPLRHRNTRTSQDEADDGLASLRKAQPQQPRRGLNPQQRWSQPSSVEGASVQAAHGGRAGISTGSSTPQRRGSVGSDVDSEEEDEYRERPAPLPTSSSMRGSTTGGVYGRPTASGSGRAPPPGQMAPPGPGPQRGPLVRSGSVQGQYAASQPRYPGPPRSESNAGGQGGAGANLYSAIAPSSRPQPPAPVEHHYYHRGSDARAPSSIGGRSNPGGRAGPPPAANNREIDTALQSIQASLAGLHERLNRVEDTGGAAARRGGTAASSNGHLVSAYRAVVNAFHDLASLLGMGGTAAGATPSFHQSSSGGSRRGTSFIRAPLALLLAVVNLAIRLALDLTSLGILITILLFGVKRITGRGDPLVLLNLARRVLGRNRAGAAERAVIVGASAAAAAVAGVANGITGEGGDGGAGRGAGAGNEAGGSTVR
ncbi:ACBP-domain-containing protein [Jaminaea rosea]|uniref:ACBP-domain-containing protein n=1 Tax=Jaminaea rosea TaxID=1569628 RepID=A0A316UZC4_9BASI|nr:ACBP-domain-containing protein [Jaminaea rosea]PWN30572.1 ACBP-domain-containing protein [Jaminaea rosea]